MRFIRRAKELGFTLHEIVELLSLRVDANRSRTDVRERASAKIEAIENKIQELQRMKRALETLSATCIGRGPTGECPILNALEDESALP